jgi:hypothetical protein
MKGTEMVDMSAGAETDQKTGLMMAMAYIGPHQVNDPVIVAEAYDYVTQMIALRILKTLRESRREYAVQMHDCRTIKFPDVSVIDEHKAVCSATVLVVDLSGAAIGEYVCFDMDIRKEYPGMTRHEGGYTFQLERVGWRFEPYRLLWKRIS